MAANMDGRPKPVSHVARFPGCVIEVACLSCGRRADLRIAEDRSPRTIAVIANRTRFHELEPRLRCRLGPRACGGSGRILQINGWSRHNGIFDGRGRRPW